MERLAYRHIVFLGGAAGYLERGRFIFGSFAAFLFCGFGGCEFCCFLRWSSCGFFIWGLFLSFVLFSLWCFVASFFPVFDVFFSRIFSCVVTLPEFFFFVVQVCVCVCVFFCYLRTLCFALFSWLFTDFTERRRRDMKCEAIEVS